MKILYDHQIFSIQKYGGASRYFCELLKNLPRENWETTTLFSNNEYLKFADLFPYHDFLPKGNFRRKSFIMNTLNKPYSLYKLKQEQYDIFHQTHFETYCLKAIGSKKMVTTFHDMNHVKFADLYKHNLLKGKSWMETVQKKSIARADKIIAISQNTKNDLINIWNINPEKIVVIYHGVDKKRIVDLDKKRIIDNPYILYVGEREGFKNFDSLAKAFSILSQEYPELKLVCTGQRFSDYEKTKLKDLKILMKTVQISADEQTMAKLYRDAEIFVFPSLSEGFGMPILEAMVYDCPVALSNTSCLPEIAQNAGVYFDPYKVEDIVDKIKQIIVNPTLRDEKISLGKERLNHFSWEKTATEHLELYRSLL